LNAHVSELKGRLGSNLKALILYGSYSYQDLDASVDTFGRLKGKGGLLDKKPDFVAVVSDLENAMLEMNRRRWFNREINRWLAGIRPDTPFYFNSTTDHAYDIQRNGGSEAVHLPFKIGIIREKEFFDLHNAGNSNIYLFCRLSKPVNILYCDNANNNGAKQRLEEQISRSRDYLLGLALSTLPRIFDGKQLIERYSAITFWCEAFRIFDFCRRREKRKYIALLKKKFYDTSERATLDMRTQVQEIVSPRIQEMKDIRDISDHGYAPAEFYEHRFAKSDKGLIPEEVVSRFLPINIFSAYASMYKNWLTTGLVKGLVYVARKVLRL
jgi:hypothetical protein